MVPRFYRTDAGLLRKKVWKKYSAIDLDTGDISTDRKHQSDVLCHVDIELHMCFFLDDEDRDEKREEPGLWSKRANQRFLNLLAWLALYDLGVYSIESLSIILGWNRLCEKEIKSNK